MLSTQEPEQTHCQTKIMGDEGMLVIHHGGMWRYKPRLTYVGGSVAVYDKLCDDINKRYILRMITDLGYADDCELKYLMPGKTFKDGMRLLRDDDDFIDLVCQLFMSREVHIFCKHEHDDDEISSSLSGLSLSGSESDELGSSWMCRGDDQAMKSGSTVELNNGKKEMDGCLSGASASVCKALDEISNGEQVYVVMARNKQQSRKRVESYAIIRRNVENPYLPEEIIHQILTKLPPKSLFRFKCVCKMWKSLISAPGFFTDHFNRSYETHSNSLLILSRYSLLSSPHYLISIDINNFVRPTVLSYERKFLLGSCNGVLCFHYPFDESVTRLQGRGPLSVFRADSVILYNPATHLSHTIAAKIHVTSRFVYGFGYDRISQGYKLLTSGCRSVCSVSRETYIVSLRSGTWKKGPTCDYTLSPDQQYGKFTNGCLHWLVETGQDGMGQSGMSVLAFDFHTETFGIVPFPILDFEDRFRDVVWSLWVLGDELCLQADYCRWADGKCCLDVWVMKEYQVEESWIKLFRIPYQDILGCQMNMKALGYSTGKRKLLVEQNSNYYWYGSDGRMTNASFGVEHCFAVEVCAGSMISLDNFQEDGNQTVIQEENEGSSYKNEDLMLEETQ